MSSLSMLFLTDFYAAKRPLWQWVVIYATVNSSPHPAHTDYPPLNLGDLPDGGEVS